MRSRRTAPTVAILVVLLLTSAARLSGKAEGLRDGQQPPTPASVSPQSVASSLDERNDCSRRQTFTLARDSSRRRPKRQSRRWRLGDSISVRCIPMSRIR